MSLFGRFIGGFKALLGGRRADRELDEELRSYLESAIADKMRAGMTREEATRLARAQMGSLDAVKEHTKDAGWEAHAESLWLDARYALRMLRKSPGFAAAAIVTLGLGIGANTAIFTVVNAVMIRPLPLKDPDRLVRIYETNKERGWDSFSASNLNYLDWVAQTTSFEHLAAYSGTSFSLMGGGETERLVALAVTHDFLPLLGVQPVSGRNFLPEEDRPGGNVRVALLTQSFFKRRFNSDPRAVGQQLTLTGEPYEVLGVLPEDFSWGDRQLDVVVPLAPDPARSRGDHRLTVIGRMKPGIPIETARVDLETVASRLATTYPENKGWGSRIITFDEWIVPEESRRSLFIFTAAVTCVLLIACGNVASLLLARASGRRREIAVRLALGASRGRLMRQLLVESMLLALIGGGAGLLLTFGSTRLLRSLSPNNIPRLDELSIDVGVLLYALGVSLVAGILFGLAPAWSASRQRHQVYDKLREAGQSTSGGGRQRLRGTLVVSEVALSVVLLVAAGLLVRSFWRVQQVNVGFQSRGITALRLTLPTNRYDNNDKAWAFYDQLLEKIRALPGVKDAAVASNVPLGAGNTTGEVTVPGKDPAVGKGPSDWRIVGPAYFKTMGIPIQGREFTAADKGDAAPVIVSRAFVARYFPREDPLGKTVILHSGGNAERMIVGIAEDVRTFGLDAEPVPLAYFPVPEISMWNPMEIVIRSEGDSASIVPSARGALRTMDPAIPFYAPTTMTELLERSMGPRRFSLVLLGTFAVVALTLASVGLFGVMAFLVSQRVHEIGVRLALGARPSNIFRLIVGRGLALATSGAAIGIAGALWVVPSIESMLYGVRATDALAFGGAPALLIAVAGLACYLPARRAMRVDPLRALRHE